MIRLQKKFSRFQESTDETSDVHYTPISPLWQEVFQTSKKTDRLLSLRSLLESRRRHRLTPR